MKRAGLVYVKIKFLSQFIFISYITNKFPNYLNFFLNNDKYTAHTNIINREVKGAGKTTIHPLHYSMDYN
jgi:hypothetical protein